MGEGPRPSSSTSLALFQHIATNMRKTSYRWLIEEKEQETGMYCCTVNWQGTELLDQEEHLNHVAFDKAGSNFRLMDEDQHD